MNKELFKDEISNIENKIWEVEGLQQGNYDVQAAQYDKLISNGLYNNVGQYSEKLF